MTTEPSQNPDFMRKHPKEGMEALEKGSKLPLKGWENEVARAKEFGLEAAKSIVAIIIINSNKSKNKACMEFLFSLIRHSNIQLTLVRSNK